MRRRREPKPPVRASLRRGRFLLIESAEGTRMKGLRAIPAERRDEAVRTMLGLAK